MLLLLTQIQFEFWNFILTIIAVILIPVTVMVAKMWSNVDGLMEFKRETKERNDKLDQRQEERDAQARLTEKEILLKVNRIETLLEGIEKNINKN
jgi:hypothetical protein